MASTFLTQKRWLDEMPLIPKPVARESGSTAALRAAMQNRMNQ
jgi:hypothetical protein